MAKKQKQKIARDPRRGNALVVVLIIILALLLMVAALMFMYWWMFFGFRPAPKPIDYGVIPYSSEPAPAKSNVDPALVGTWESNCLVPDLNSPWSEKHQFIINADGTAQHTRWSSGDHFCSPQTTMVDKYKINTPTNGKVEFSTLEGVGPGNDIYQVIGNTLLFGHGFRNHYSYVENTLNEYIAYKKVAK